MKNKLSTLLSIGILAIILAVPVVVLAGEATDWIEFKNPLNCNDLETCITDFLSLALAIAIPIATIYFLWAGVKLIKAGAEGNEAELGKAKKALLWSIIGLFVLGSLTGITAIIKSLLNVKS